MDLFNRWHKGIKQLSPAQLAHGKIIGNFGTIIGLILAMITMFWQGLWYWSFFLMGMIWLQSIELISSIQKYENIKQIMEEE